jgi:YndJ-like protein
MEAGMSGVFPLLVLHLTLVDLLLLFATLVIVPLGLRLVPFAGPRARRVLGVARIVQPFGALAAVASFFITPGWTAAAVALGWLITCAVASLAGLMELIDRRSLRPVHLVPAAAVAYLSVGAGWLVLSRAGLRPEGFSHEIVELTGVHFHYAGFAATLMGALTIGAVRDRGRLARFASGAAMLVVIGVPITAAGIATGSGLLTVAGPVLLGTGVLSIAGITGLAIAPRVLRPAARWLLWVSAAGVVVPMLLGVDYAIGRVVPIPALDLRAMSLIHGDLNALVFALCGLLGWTLVRRPPAADVTLLARRPSEPGEPHAMPDRDPRPRR